MDSIAYLIQTAEIEKYIVCKEGEDKEEIADRLYESGVRIYAKD